MYEEETMKRGRAKGSGAADCGRGLSVKLYTKLPIRPSMTLLTGVIHAAAGTSAEAGISMG
jgi:hypothetical protein